jgi:hypothetical protein
VLPVPYWPNQYVDVKAAAEFEIVPLLLSNVPSM